MIPCCLSIVSCKEYEEHIKQGKTVLGGAIGIADHCPKDAEEAGRLQKKLKKATSTHSLSEGTSIS